MLSKVKISFTKGDKQGRFALLMLPTVVLLTFLASHAWLLRHQPVPEQPLACSYHHVGPVMAVGWQSWGWRLVRWDGQCASRVVLMGWLKAAAAGEQPDPGRCFWGWSPVMGLGAGSPLMLSAQVEAGPWAGHMVVLWALQDTRDFTFPSCQGRDGSLAPQGEWDIALSCQSLLMALLFGPRPVLGCSCFLTSGATLLSQGPEKHRSPFTAPCFQSAPTALHSAPFTALPSQPLASSLLPQLSTVLPLPSCGKAWSKQSQPAPYLILVPSNCVFLKRRKLS